MNWHKKIEGRTVDGCDSFVEIEVWPGNVSVECFMEIEGQPAVGPYAARFSVDMARDLRAALDEAIERASEEAAS